MSKGSSKLKSWAMGLGTTGYVLVYSAAQSGAACGGTCGACGFHCLGAVVPVIVIGGLSLVRRRYRQCSK